VGLSKIILVLVIALIAWMFYKKFVSDAQRLVKGAERKRKATANNTKGTLVLDPKTGEYRLKRDAEE
jgi:membrane protein implicated in regulation of membrane protease activity